MTAPSRTAEILAFAKGARARYETAVTDDARGVARSPIQWRGIAADLALSGDALYGLLRDGLVGTPDSEAPLITSGVIEATWARARDARDRAAYQQRVDALVAQQGS